MAAAKAQMPEFSLLTVTQSSQASFGHVLAIWVQHVCKGYMLKSFEFTYMSRDTAP